jgi:hypothetical protein
MLYEISTALRRVLAERKLREQATTPRGAQEPPSGDGAPPQMRGRSLSMEGPRFTPAAPPPPPPPLSPPPSTPQPPPPAEVASTTPHDSDWPPGSA